MIVFQDFDGVLNSENFFFDWKKKNPEKSNQDFFEEFCKDREYVGYLQPDLVERFKRMIYSHEDIYIVCSSSWRTGVDLEYLKRMYKQRGLPYDRLVDVTPDLHGRYIFYSRQDEIYSYMEEKDPMAKAIVLDDLWVKENRERYPNLRSISVFPNTGLSPMDEEEFERMYMELKGIQE